MSYRAASYAGISVVSCKTDKGIIRAIEYPSYPHYHRRSTYGHNLVNAIISQVGALNLEGTEWTGFFYQTEPYYLYSTPGCHIEREIESGVWLYPWKVPPTTERYGCELGISDHTNPIKLSGL